MDSYGFVDSIQVEKANALARYRRFNNISKMFRVIEVLLAVVLISWSSSRLPTLFKVSGEYLYAFSSYVLNQHVVFVVGNLIVVICYVLSRHTEVGNESAGPEIDNRFRSTDQFITTEAVTKIEPVTPPVEELPEAKQVVMEEVDEKVVNVKTETELTVETELTAIKKAAKQIERFKRTQSVRLRREIAMKSRKELRRSVTDTERSVAGDSPSPLIETVQRLSNEEFQLAMEAFISKQRSLLKQQSMVEE